MLSLVHSGYPGILAGVRSDFRSMIARRFAESTLSSFASATRSSKFISDSRQMALICLWIGVKLFPVINFLGSIYCFRFADLGGGSI